MKHFLQVLIILLLASTYTTAQNWVWGLKGTGSNQGNNGTAKISVDNNGNSVIAGYFQQDMTLDGHALSSPDDYYKDMFLGRVDTKGHVLWLISIEGGETYGDYIGLTTDDDKNIYLTGGKDGCIFVSKYDSTGVLVWTNDFGKKYYGYGRDVAVDQFDNVVVIGGGGWDFFIAKLNIYGDQLWLKDTWMNYSNAVNANDLAVDASGNIYFIATNGMDSIKYDNILIKQRGSSFWGKIDPTGKFVWIKASSGTTDERPQIALTSDNNLILSGGFSSTLKIDKTILNGYSINYNWNTFISKYDTSGNFMWAKATFTDIDGGAPREMKVDYNSNIYLAGNYFTCYGCTEGDYYLKKYNSSGDLLFRKDYKSLIDDKTYGIDIDNNGNLYNIGYTGSASFIEELPNFTTGSMGVGKLNTLSSTTKRTERPVINRLIYNCKGSELTSITATGQNIKWYDDPTLSKLLYNGNQYQINLQATDTFYVTQTLNNIESWPKEVIVYSTDISNEKVSYNKDTLYTTPNKYFSYKWSLNNVEIPNANKNFYLPTLNGNYKVEIVAGGCTRTLDFAFERPATPVSERIRYVCYKQPVGTLSALGENVIWYGDSSYNDTISLGNQYNPEITENKTYYVRQTVNGISSYPQKVMVKFSELSDKVLKYGPNYLYTTYNKRFTYQWYYENELIENADSNIYVPQKNGLYSVEINDSICSKSLSQHFVQQPIINSTLYYVCSNENMPTLTAEGQNLTWLSYDYQKQVFETLCTGNSFTPLFNESRTIYLSQSINGFSSFPLYIQVICSNFSSLTVNDSGYSLSISSTDYSNSYSYKWYLNNDTIPIYNYSDFYDSPFGNYKIKVSLDTGCDTILNYSYHPTFDSIQYVCSNATPILDVASNNIQWYTDVNLKNLISYGRTLYPYLDGKDSTFYIAQFRNNKVVWRGQIKVVYPGLDKLEIIKKDNLLAISNPKTYFRYVWQFNNKVLDSDGPNCQLDAEGIYSVNVQAGNCSVKLNYAYIKNSINALEGNLWFRIYPNPTKDFVSIELNAPTNEDILVKLYSANGQLIKSTLSNTSKITLDLRKLEIGLYFLELKSGLNSYNCKIIKAM